MKKLTTIVLLLLFTVVFTIAQDFNKSMADIMINMKSYTIEMVELMPEEQFDYKPADSVRAFGEQVKHMIATNHFLVDYFLIGDQKANRENALQASFANADYTMKADIVIALADEFDKTIRFFENASSDHYQKTYTFGTPENPITKDYFTTAMLIRDHISHHRSQLIVYLRMNDIEPAQFRGF